MGSSVQIGNAGEHFVMSCLLSLGCHAGLADRGNPHFDLLVRKPAGGFCSVRVKATRGDTFQWTAKTNWDPLPGFDKDNPDPYDLTVLVAFNNKLPGTSTEVYIMPTERLVRDINVVHEHYHQFPNRDGSERKWSTQRVLRLSGEVRPDNVAYGFRLTWAEYKDGWPLITGD